MLKSLPTIENSRLSKDKANARQTTKQSKANATAKYGKVLCNERINTRVLNRYECGKPMRKVANKYAHINRKANTHILQLLTRATQARCFIKLSC